MAQRGRPLDEPTRRFIRRAAEVNSIRKTARLAEVSRNTARKVLRQAGSGS